MVPLCRDSGHNGADDMDDFNGNEVFLSDDKFDLQDLLRGQIQKYQSRESGLKESPVGYAEFSSSSLQAYS
ncbi:hypothetical protein HPB48_026048 [Haemaphysalis longicornis]|uniref:Uncharacterized protein n=1 Tax=Haemaphysalis longicornis TaxID=44386 RepID=A0A9J6HAR4_HAELO|nr:hypothetical protein HPB48_026048 [Haemaphysalis longicornis]